MGGEAIAVGGSIAQASEFFEQAARDELKDFAYPESIRQLHIFFSSIPNVALLGAAALTKTVAKPNGQQN